MHWLVEQKGPVTGLTAITEDAGGSDDDVGDAGNMSSNFRGTQRSTLEQKKTKPNYDCPEKYWIPSKQYSLKHENSFDITPK